ncbi:larval cuticle protein LCP-17-like [Anticarsia gemmatalis]|uniref:larval cuticle protein LCP-17-like n=1 Tax=Anticarsia gemmatalis TaxID=129554 RepID=UPI003F75F6CF
MKFFAVFAVALACAAADVKHLNHDDFHAAIVKSNYDITPEGAFQYAYETANGIYAQSNGQVKNANSDYPTLEVSGNYKYTSPEGVPVELSYTADENGYQPVGAHLPVAHPIPEAIARSLAYIAAHPPPVDGKSAVKPQFG